MLFLVLPAAKLEPASKSKRRRRSRIRNTIMST